MFKTIASGLIILSGLLSFFLPDQVLAFPLVTRVGAAVTSVVILLFLHFLNSILRILNATYRSIFLFFSKFKVIRVGIAIDSTLDSELVRYCNEEIKKYGLSSTIKFNTEPRKVTEKNFKKVARSVMGANKDLVVWSKEPLVGDRVLVAFTYKDTIKNHIRRVVNAAMFNLVSREKMFSFGKESFILDLKLERKNIVFFSLYIVALCTSMFRGPRKGISIFESLLEELNSSNSFLKDLVTDNLVELYSIVGRDLNSKKRYLEAIELLEKGYRLNSTDPNILATLAWAHYFTGNKSRAEKVVSDLRKNNPGFPVAHLDAAFFRILEKNYNTAIKEYALFKRSKPEPEVILEAITFLSERLDESPDELAFLFARGLLKKMTGNDVSDTKIGETNFVDDLKAFIQRASLPKYAEMVKYAKEKLLPFKSA